MINLTNFSLPQNPYFTITWFEYAPQKGYSLQEKNVVTELRLNLSGPYKRAELFGSKAGDRSRRV